MRQDERKGLADLSRDEPFRLALVILIRTLGFIGGGAVGIGYVMLFHALRRPGWDLALLGEALLNMLIGGIAGATLGVYLGSALGRWLNRRSDD
jgi:hypothetical protein